MPEFPSEAAPEIVNSWPAQRHRDEPVGRVEGVGADVAVGHPHDRDAGRRGEALQPVQVGVDGGGFPVGVGEDRHVEAGDATLDAQQEKAGALHARPSLGWLGLL
jgi:hypothetical protein